MRVMFYSALSGFEALHVSKHTTKNCVIACPGPSELLAGAGEKAE
jgi:hypothetical protein